MIKVILLDNGGVLVDDSWPTYVRETSARLGLSEDEFRTKTRSIVRPALIGEIDRQEFTKKLIETIGSDEGVPKLGTVKPIRKGIESWLSDLKQRDYRLAILSNDFGDFAGNNAKYWHYERFCGDEIFYSTKLGVSKPNKDAFIAVLGKLNVRPTETIFLDDKKRNTDAASELGMNVIQFESLEQAKRELEIILERENVEEILCDNPDILRKCRPAYWQCLHYYRRRRAGALLSFPVRRQQRLLHDWDR